MAPDTENERRIARAIAAEIGARQDQVVAAAGLLDGGATVPFVARYRKEATGGLDDGQLRTLAERLGYLREMEARRGSVLASVRDQGKLTPELEAAMRRQAAKRVALQFSELQRVTWDHSKLGGAY